LRALADHLPMRQNWKLVDNDLGLLSRAKDTKHPRAKVTTAAVDLAHDLEAALDGAVDLVTNSALLDLVSEDWLERLAVESAARKLPLYAALIYDGRISIEPSDPFDAAIMKAASKYQHRDQGFGPALGTDAASHAIAQLESVGYSIVHGFADWTLGALDREIQTAFFESWAGAAREAAQLPIADINRWLARRHDAVASGKASMSVGHVDIFADPIGLR